MISERKLVETIFLGGGTPSYFGPNHLHRLLHIINSAFQTTPDLEFSCEVNPLDCTTERLEILRSAGVNRISIGGQSFSDRKLGALERDHTGDQLIEAIQRCTDRFSNVSLDLIFAAPQESFSEWKSDVEAVLRNPIQHLSTYGLTIERGAAFYGRVMRDELSPVQVEDELRMYEFVIESMQSAGWQHYEVSNFARSGYQCIHNLNYWQGNPWWAFGPGAASFLPAQSNGDEECHNEISGDMVRQVNHRSTTRYIRLIQDGRSPVAESESLNGLEQLREKFVFGLRQMAGVNLQELRQWWGEPIQPIFEPYLSRYIAEGLLLQEGQVIRLSQKGLIVSDSLWPDLLSP